MAIIKPFETPHGVAATYHKIRSATFHSETQTVELTVAVYASPEAREEGKAPLWHEYPVIPFAALNQDPRRVLYPMLTCYQVSYLDGGESDAPAPDTFALTLALPDEAPPEEPPIDPEPPSDPEPTPEPETP